MLYSCAYMITVAVKGLSLQPLMMVMSCEQ